MQAQAGDAQAQPPAVIWPLRSARCDLAAVICHRGRASERETGGRLRAGGQERRILLEGCMLAERSRRARGSIERGPLARGNEKARMAINHVFRLWSE